MQEGKKNHSFLPWKESMGFTPISTNSYNTSKWRPSLKPRWAQRKHLHTQASVQNLWLLSGAIWSIEAGTSLWKHQALQRLIHLKGRAGGSDQVSIAAGKRPWHFLDPPALTQGWHCTHHLPPLVLLPASSYSSLKNTGMKESRAYLSFQIVWFQFWTISSLKVSFQYSLHAVISCPISCHTQTEALPSSLLIKHLLTSVSAKLVQTFLCLCLPGYNLNF